MKLVRLPKGQQKGIKGAAVNVPADLDLHVPYFQDYLLMHTL